MREAGFVTDGQDSDNADATECAFALTERLTGVPMTAALLHSAPYVVTAVYTAVSTSSGEAEDDEWSGHVAVGPASGFGDVGASGQA